MACCRGGTLPDHIRVSVNVSAGPARSDPGTQVAAALAASVFRQNRLELEITEAVLDFAMN